MSDQENQQRQSMTPPPLSNGNPSVPSVAPVVPEEQKISISRDDLLNIQRRLDLIEKQNELLQQENKNLKESSSSSDVAKMAQLIKDLVESQASSKPGAGRTLVGFRTSIDGVVDPDDVLETPAVFFASGLSTAIVDDTRNGVNVRTPYNRMFRFVNLYTHARPSVGGKNPDRISMCVFKTHSKKEAQWLREHTFFGIKFFEEAKETVKLDTKLMDFVSYRVQELSKKAPAEIHNLCLNHGIKVDTTDTKELRRRLADKLGRADYDQYRGPVPIEVNMKESVGGSSSVQGDGRVPSSY